MKKLENNEEKMNPGNRNEPMLLDVQNAAKLLNLSRSYLYRETRARRIPHIKIGSRILFRTTDLQAWLEKQYIDSDSNCA